MNAFTARLINELNTHIRNCDGPRAVQIVDLIGRHAVYGTAVYRFNDGTTRTVELVRNPHNNIVEYVYFKLVSYGNIDLY